MAAADLALASCLVTFGDRFVAFVVTQQLACRNHGARTAPENSSRWVHAGPGNRPAAAALRSDTPGRESYQWLTWGCAQPYCPYQSAA
jgi:hypothetical protein